MLLAASSRNELLASIAEFQRPHAGGRAFEIWNRAQLSSVICAFPQAANHIRSYRSPDLSQPQTAGRRFSCATSTRAAELWRFEFPAICRCLLSRLQISGMELVRQLMLTHVLADAGLRSRPCDPESRGNELRRPTAKVSDPPGSGAYRWSGRGARRNLPPGLECAAHGRPDASARVRQRCIDRPSWAFAAATARGDRHSGHTSAGAIGGTPGV